MKETPLDNNPVTLSGSMWSPAHTGGEAEAQTLELQKPHSCQVAQLELRHVFLPSAGLAP